MTFPARSIIGLEMCAGACGEPECPALVIACDCGTTTHLTVEVQGTGTAEAAFSCDGCTTVTWFTVTKDEPQE